jgi:Protein of unknown function (DUF429)
MLTLGVDFAAQPQKTAACSVKWQSGAAEVSSVELNVDDWRFAELAAECDKIGMDVPFGWPVAFAEAIGRHHRHESWPSVASGALRFRDTDRNVWEKTGGWPLSVSTDRIGVTAFRAARLLSPDVDRAGSGRFVEVYSAAALRRWNLIPAGPNDSHALLAALASRTREWLVLSAETHRNAKQIATHSTP